MTTSDPKRIGLALSGGGFRATLFHLGVIRFLRESSLLPRVKVICSVSGGSILGAHLSLNWAAYTGDEQAFDAVTRSLIDFTKLDVRGRVLRRWLYGVLLVAPRFAGRYTFASLLGLHYSHLYEQASLGMLGKSTDQPDLHILATSLTTGTLCKFTKDGFVFVDGDRERLIRTESLPVSTAVSASSAFPPLFPPIPITRELLNADAKDFDKTQFLTDGGVFDNLGLYELCRISRSVKKDGLLIIVSNAGANFDWTIGNKYSSVLSRNVRATDILMDRVCKLVPATTDVKSFKLCAIDIGRELAATGETMALPAELQRSARNIRTDLDSVSDIEIVTLISHGYAEARAALMEIGISSGGSSPDWKPFGSRTPVPQSRDLEIEDAKRRRLSLFAFRDVASWLVCFGLLCWFAALIGVPALVIAHFKSQVQQSALLRSEQEISLLNKTNDTLEQAAQQRVVLFKVIDASNYLAVPNAQVSLVADHFFEQRTSDSEGLVSFGWSSISAPLQGDISVKSDGYVSREMKIHSYELPFLIMLTRKRREIGVFSDNPAVRR